MSLAKATCLVAGLALPACNSEPKPAPPPASALPLASAAASAPAAPSASAPGRPGLSPATRPGCRVLALTGQVQEGASPLANGALTYGTSWLSLGKDASLTLRHTATTREVTLRGPGRALPCLDGEEDTLLVEGSLESTAGAGARPGAEVAIFTPLGTISYGDAQISIRASKTRVEVSSTKGEAWVFAAKSASRKGPEKLAAAKDKTVLTGPGTVEALLKDCEQAAEQAEALGRAVLAPAGGDAGSLGDRAAAHLRARQAARRACGAARAGASAEPDADKRGGFEQRVEQAGRRWKSLGAPGAPAAKSSAE